MSACKSYCAVCQQENTLIELDWHESFMCIHKCIVNNTWADDDVDDDYELWGKTFF